jgi:hypothetical protein
MPRGDVAIIGSAERSNDLLREKRRIMTNEWRCFHCDEVFTEHAAALEHFGESMCDDPACQIDMTDVRAMENQLRQYRNEDTELHRAIHSMQADHAVALRREEEKGYERGLRDYSELFNAANRALREISGRFPDVMSARCILKHALDPTSQSAKTEKP